MPPKWHPDQASKIHTEPAWALPLAFGFAAAFALAFASAAMASAKRSNLETTAKSPCRQKFRQQYCGAKTGNWHNMCWRKESYSDGNSPNPCNRTEGLSQAIPRHMCSKFKRLSNRQQLSTLSCNLCWPASTANLGASKIFSNHW